MPQAATPFSIETDANYKIRGTLYVGQKRKNVHLIVICSAAAAPQHYYTPFAEFVSGQFEFDAITFDYSGIGLSKPGLAKNSKATMTDWGKHDIKAVIDWASDKYEKIFLIGHSVAGQVFPLAENKGRISAAYFVAAQSAYIGYYRGFPKLKAALLWRVIIPTATALFGFLPGWSMGSKVPLPKGAAREWRQWGLNKHGMTLSDEKVYDKYNDLHIPIHFVGLSDDTQFAPMEAIQALMHRYGNAKTSYQYIRPKDMGLKSIGHFGFFRSKYQEKLWSMPIMYFTQYIRKF